MKRRTLFGVLLAPIAAVACPAKKVMVMKYRSLGFTTLINIPSIGAVPFGTSIQVPNPRHCYRLNKVEF